MLDGLGGASRRRQSTILWKRVCFELQQIFCAPHKVDDSSRKSNALLEFKVRPEEVKCYSVRKHERLTSSRRYVFFNNLID